MTDSATTPSRPRAVDQTAEPLTGPLGEAVAAIRGGVQQLQGLEAGIGHNRPFTLDGHLVGSIGEAIAANHLGVRLDRPGQPGFDGRRGDRPVQIKATQRNTIAIRGEPGEYDGVDFIVIRLHLQQVPPAWELVYDGPAGPVFAVAGKASKRNGQRRVSLSRLITEAKKHL